VAYNGNDAGEDWYDRPVERIDHAESILAEGSLYASPDWFTWFSPARLAAFKGNTQLKAEHLPQAKETLLAVLNDPSIAGNRDAA
jgi:hypothetical protein